jgi:hypothetical protein
MPNPHETLAARNHNPLNMRPLPNGEKWQGQIGVDRNPVTGAFCKFENNVYGVRAAVIQMRSYVRMWGCKTLRDVIYRWAPPPKKYDASADGSAVNGEDMNNTEAYVRVVAASANVSPYLDMTWLSLPGAKEYGEVVGNSRALARIIAAMNAHEAGGRTADDREIEQGIALALQLPKGYVRTDDGNVIREDIKQSETIKAADNGMAATGVTAIGGVVAPIAATVAGADPIVAAIICGTILIIAAGVAVYFLRKARRERVKMHEEGIA